MIVYHRPYDPDQHSRQSIYNIVEKDNALSFEYKVEEYCGQIVLDSILYQGRVIDLIAVNNDGFTHTYVVDLLTQDPINRIAGGKRVARIVFDQRPLIGLCGRCTDIDKASNVHIKDDKQITDYLLENELFAKTFKAYKAKTKLFHELRIFDSISYLETQVDLLTRIVLKTGGKSEEVKLLKKFAPHLSPMTTIDSDVDNKQKVRAWINTYLKERE